MGYRRKAREMALQILFQGEYFPEANLKENEKHFLFSFPVQKEIELFGSKLYEGVCEHLEDIDLLLQKYSEHWKLYRMSPIDRNILRIALFEMVYLKDIPASVSIDEAIEIAKHYGTEDSGAFVNGILDKILKKEIQKNIVSKTA
ncbi:MAG: transcription antitermination factor NusB [Deltaproteobacteria bacterium]|nr:transcription antitermination factor NusB [Deltaproteobacteria bacterium]